MMLVAVSGPEIRDESDTDAPRDREDRVRADSGSGEEAADGLGHGSERLILSELTKTLGHCRGRHEAASQ
jgi:hypothetical protein